MTCLLTARRYLQCLAAGVLLSLSSIASTAAAQSVAGVAFQLAHRRSQVQLPYRAQRNLIIVSARLNGLGPYNFILDTGVNVSLLLNSSLRDTLHLISGQRYRVAGVGEGEAIEAFQVDSVRVELPGVVGPAVSFLMLGPNTLDFSGYVGLPIHGILGSDVFRSFVVTVNPATAHLVLHEPSRFKAPKGRRWTVLPLDLEGGKPYVTAQVTMHDSTTTSLRLLLDTGAGHSLSLDIKSGAGLRYPCRGVKTSLGRGLSGVITGYLGRTTTVQLGCYALSSLITSFPDTSRARPHAFDGFRNGSLGYEALNRFVSVIDYPHNRLLLKPSTLYRRPFEQDASGMELVAVGPEFRRFQITLVQAGSPADSAGLLVNDEVLFINFIPTATLSLTQISELLQKAGGHRLTLLVRRADGELSSAVLSVKRVL